MDRTKVLHSPRTQTYGETNYLKILSFGQNQGVAWSSDSNLWGNQPLKKLSFGQNQGVAWSSDSNLWGNQLLRYQVLDKAKVLHDSRTQTYGKPNYFKETWIPSKT